jgi:hypothetical protein
MREGDGYNTISVLLQGNITSGYKPIGPFATFESAARWDDENGDNQLFSGWIAQMEPPKLSVGAKECADQIYDTLMGNVGMSEYHTGFDLDQVEDQQVDADKGEISFKYHDRFYKMILMEE